MHRRETSPSSQKQEFTSEEEEDTENPTLSQHAVATIAAGVLAQSGWPVISLVP